MGRCVSQIVSRLEGRNGPYLLLVRPARLHGALGIPDLLQHAATVFQPLREDVFLLGDLGQQHAELIADVAHSIVVGGLAPVAQLAGNCSAFF